MGLISITGLLYHWLSRQVEQDALAWLNQKRRQISEGASNIVFFTAFSAGPRYIGKQDLQLTQDDWQAIEIIRPGWFPVNWSCDRVARILLLLALPQDNPDEYVQRIEQVFNVADVSELVTLYQALPILPFPERFRLRAAEGIRSNMTAVFNAVALQNPYPAEYFDNIAWNQMVLKALFVGSSLNLIYGLEQRNNSDLSQMLIDYAREREAANRSVSRELWELVGNR
ncbi:MAG: EboA family metabolite traffic protein [Hydrococcus sp. RU_2_2]|nr:EboA family metabolite traffic protein [Hydrococcus sp. RU_2_2]NJP21209.1 EboA family metabolite traffic protein [Hydrococcus sp. CRU_1_1]